MASKKFKNKKCVYCVAEESTSTGDHVFPRQLFLEQDRVNLPKVACCKKCNDKKSKLEHYLLSVLPFGAQHECAEDNLNSMLPKRLANNQKLHCDLKNRTKYEYGYSKYGVVIPKLMIPIDTQKLLDLIKYFTVALVWEHFKVQLQPVDVVEASLDFNIDSFHNGSLKSKVFKQIGKDTMSYTGIQANDSDKITAWEFVIYGGVELSNCLNRKIIAVTGPKEINKNIELRLKDKIYNYERAWSY